MASEKVDPRIPILLAESDPDSISAFEGLFREFQLRRVTVAKDAKDVFEILRSKEAPRYGAILLSASISGMSSLKVIAVLRAGGENAETPIIFLYGSEEESLVDSATAAGASVALEIPIQEDTLRATLEQFLGKSIATKSEEENISAKYVEATREAIGSVVNLRAEGNFEAAETAYMGALLALFTNTAELYRSRGEEEKVGIILEEGEKVFPDIRERFENGSPSSEDSQSGSEKEESPGAAGDRFDPRSPVLFAEADSEARTAFDPIFNELQFQNVTTAEDGFGVLSLDDSIRFTLILLSSSLTDMDPKQVLAALRTEGENTETPVILLHGPGEDSLVEEMKAAGVVAVLEKPVEVDSLRTTIEELLSMRIASKREEEEHSAQYIEATSNTAEAVQALQKEGLFDGAQGGFLEALRDLFLGTAEMYLTKGDKRQAELILGEAKKLFPDIMSDFQPRPDAFIQRGNEYLKDEQFSQAKAEFEAALTLNEQSMEACLGLGESLLGLGDMGGVQMAFRRAVQSPEPPQTPNILNQVGMLACRHELYEVAHEAYDRLLSVYQLDARLYYNKSLVHVRQKEFGKALPLLSRALTLDEEFSAAKVLHKKVRNWMGQMPEVAEETTQID